MRKPTKHFPVSVELNRTLPSSLPIVALRLHSNQTLASSRYPNATVVSQHRFAMVVLVNRKVVSIAIECGPRPVIYRRKSDARATQCRLDAS